MLVSGDQVHVRLHVRATFRETPLAALHRELGARMVPFAGYSMPVQYPTGILAEHNQMRTAAGLFDVSHMGQAALVGPRPRDHRDGAGAHCARRFRRPRAGSRALLACSSPSDGGIIDDLMVTRPTADAPDGVLLLVVNAGAEGDRLRRPPRRACPASVPVEPLEDRALLALQGRERRR